MLSILLQPLEGEENTKLEFEDLTTGGNVPKQYVPAIKKVNDDD